MDKPVINDTCTTTAELLELARRHTWFPNGHEQADFGLPGKISVSQEGNYYTDLHGQRYLEALSGFAGCTLGRSTAAIVEAIVEELRANPIIVSGGGATPKQIRLSSMIAARMPDRGAGLQRVFYSLSGSDANETAFKIARQYWKARGQGGRYKIISRWGSYHGGHAGALAASGYTFRRAGAEPLMPGFIHTNPPQCYFCPYRCYPECNLECAEELARTIEREDPSTIAAWIGDLVITALGPLPPPPGYPQRIREICDAYGILMIVDEVVTGWGRMGTWTASEYYGVVPDMITLAKGLSALYVPLAATVVKEEIAALFTGQNLLQHVYTMAGNPVSCAAGLAVIEYLERERILAEVQRKAAVVAAENRKLGEEFRCVGATYEVGLEFGVQLVRDRARREKLADPVAAGKIIVEAGLRHNVTLFPFGGCVVNAPSLTITDEELATIFVALRAGLGALDATLG